MSDERLRELERRFQESGDAVDEEAWLRERLRLGELTRDVLHLAAGLGCAAAQRITDRPDPIADPRRRLVRVVRAGLLTGPAELVRLEDPRVLVTWALDCARRGLPAAEVEDDLALAARAASGAPDAVAHAHTRRWELRAAARPGVPSVPNCMADLLDLALTVRDRDPDPHKDREFASRRCRLAVSIARAAGGHDPAEAAQQVRRLLELLLAR